MMDIGLYTTACSAPFELPPDTVVTAAEEIDQLHQRIESLAEQGQIETDVSELIDELEMMRLRPLNLNKASNAELSRIPFLNELQISGIIRHRELHGNFMSIAELQSVGGMTLEVIEDIAPYVSVHEDVFERRITFKDIMYRGRSQYYVRLQGILEEFPQLAGSFASKTSSGQVYPGSPLKVYSRYKFSYYNNLSIGITAEKDQGEEFFRGSQKRGFDYYSAHFFLRKKGIIKALALGDFQVQLGQGLTLWSGLSFGKSTEVISIRKNALGLKPYTSVDENNFMRGAGITLGFPHIEITGFISYKNRDAGVVEPDTVTQETLIISGLQQTGLHRTLSELTTRHSVSERISGANITFKKNAFHAGISVYGRALGGEYKNEVPFYNLNQANTSGSWHSGFDYGYIYKNINFFGEAATGKSGGYAFINGLMVSLDPRLSLSLLYRNFSIDYQSPFGMAFSENTKVANEKGLFLGLAATLSYKWSVNAYADHFVFPWMKYRTYSPSRGYEYMVQVKFRPEKNIEIYTIYRIKNKPLNLTETQDVYKTADAIKQNFRLHLSYPVTKGITFRNRLEWADYRTLQKHQDGFLIYQDIIYQPLNSRLRITFRYALFDTDGYDSRIYAYENDVLYAWSFPFYSGTGQRTYIIIRWKAGRYADVQLRLGRQVVFPFSTSQRDAGNHETDIKIQIRLHNL